MIEINHNNHFCGDYLKGLQKEREKIQVFSRELPLCLQIVTQAIEACKQQMCSRSEDFDEEPSESDEQIIVSSKLSPIVGQFFPISPSRTSSDEEQSHLHILNYNNFSNEKSANKKPDWLKSAQLWNEYPDSPTRTSSVAFHPFKRDKRANSTPELANSLPSGPKVATSSSAKSSGISNKEKESKGKTRRSWSHELHKRFLDTLQQLGGSHVATPKQIREVMKEDGLTNDEIKSHLQKYRLHERRPNASLNNHNQTNAPHFLVVGGIWVPPPEYAIVATSPLPEEANSRTANKIYAPVAAPPPHHHCNEKRWGNNMVNSSSPDNSPTTHAY